MCVQATAGVTSTVHDQGYGKGGDLIGFLCFSRSEALGPTDLPSLFEDRNVLNVFWGVS